MSLKKLFFPLCLAMLLLPTACTEKESDLGINLQDPFTLYHGTRCSIPLTAATLYDDSLTTIGYTSGVFGNYDDPVFGTVEAIVYSQVTIPSSTGINFSDDAVIDSVKMTLIIDTLMSSTPEAASHDLHVIVNQLAEVLDGDSVYYASCQLAEGACLFDGTVTYAADSVVLMLNETAHSMLRQSCSTADFLTRTKGIAVKMAPNAQAMATVNYAATATRITMFYHTPTAEALTYVFTINGDAAHCMGYRHNYAGTPLAPLADGSQQQLDGSTLLYMEPLGGTKVRLNMQPFLDTFCANHPTAIVHYAELIMPVADASGSIRTERLLAYKRAADGSVALATDGNYITNPSYDGFDGYYNTDKQCYRLRVTRHVQELLRGKQDYGTDIYVDGRRSSAFHTVLNGTTASDPIRIEFIYTE